MSSLLRVFAPRVAPPPPGASEVLGPSLQQQNELQRLVSRVQTSAVAQDRRDALSALCSFEGAGRQMTRDNVALLVNVTKMHLDDPEFLVKVVELFSNITDETQVPDQHLREAFLAELMNIELFLSILRDDQFWTRYNAVQVLQRLQQHDDSAVVKQLLAHRGVQPLIDILNDGSNGGALRNEGLLLLNNLTAVNEEVQTILAFENCFDSLFNIIDEEGGVEGDVVVKDCLAVMHNMLRSNQASQKLFMELHAARLVGLLRDCPPTSPSSPLTANSAAIVHSATVVLTSVLRCADSHGGGAAARTSFCRSGVLQALALVGFTSNKMEAHITIQAVRALASLLEGHKQACELFINTKIRFQQAQLVPVAWLALRLLLYEGEDRAKQHAALLLVNNLLAAGGTNAAAFLTRGVVPLTRRSADHGLQCGQLLGGSLFSGDPRAGYTTYFAAWVLSRCATVPQVAEQLLHVPWENNMTFFTAFVHHVSTTIQQHKADLATIACMLRPIFHWISFTGGASVSLLSDPAAHRFFADWATQSREPPQVRLLCATLHAHLCNVAPVVRQGTMQVTKEDLVTYFTQRVVPTLDRTFYDCRASSEWQSAPVDMTTSQSPVIFDAPLCTFVQDALQQWRDSFSVEARGGHAVASCSTDDVPQPPAVPQPALESRGGSTSESDQFAVTKQNEHSTSSTPSAAANGHHEDLQRTLDELAHERQMRERLQQLMDEQRWRAEQSERQLQELRSQHEAAERFFSETLAAKDGELQTLVDSMSMLESRLVSANETQQSIQQLESDVERLRSDREELLIMVAEMDEENQMLRQAHESSGISLVGVERSAEKKLSSGDDDDADLSSVDSKGNLL